MRSRRTAANDDQREPLKQRHVVVLLALKLRAASKHVVAISSGCATPLHTGRSRRKHTLARAAIKRKSMGQATITTHRQEFQNDAEAIDKSNPDSDSLAGFAHPVENDSIAPAIRPLEGLRRQGEGATQSPRESELGSRRKNAERFVVAPRLRV